MKATIIIHKKRIVCKFEKFNEYASRLIAKLYYDTIYLPPIPGQESLAEDNIGKDVEIEVVRAKLRNQMFKDRAKILSVYLINDSSVQNNNKEIF